MKKVLTVFMILCLSLAYSITALAIDIEDHTVEKVSVQKEQYTTYATTPGYDRASVISYANRYATTHNPLFTDYGDADCTNYVSQCLLAGGLQTDGVWNIPGTTAGTVAWTTADGLKNYLKDYGLATKLSSWSKHGTPDPYKTWAK